MARLSLIEPKTGRPLRSWRWEGAVPPQTLRDIGATVSAFLAHLPPEGRARQARLMMRGLARQALRSARGG